MADMWMGYVVCNMLFWLIREDHCEFSLLKTPSTPTREGGGNHQVCKIKEERNSVQHDFCVNAALATR